MSVYHGNNLISGKGAEELNKLTDVNISSPSNDQVLKYNSTTSKWENGTASSGANTDLSNLSATGEAHFAKPTQTASITDASTITLASNTIYTGTTLTALTVALPASYDTTFIAQLNFTSGSTATTWSAPNTIKFIGDDTASNIFTPVINKTYTVFIYADSASTCRGVVSGIATA